MPASWRKLCPSNFDLGETPAVFLGAAFTKNGKPAEQPLPADIAQTLRDYLAGREVDAPIWPGTWAEKAADMLRLDLDAAGIPYVIDGPNGPLFADFHALRHSYVGLLDDAGATVKQAMSLARHGDPKLTMARYGRPELDELARVIDRMPSILEGAPAEVWAATGTDDERPNPNSLSKACSTGEQRRGFREHKSTGSLPRASASGSEKTPAKPRDSEGFEGVKGSSPTRTRT